MIQSKFRKGNFFKKYTDDYCYEIQQNSDKNLV